MAIKPTYEELEQRVKGLENGTLAPKRSEETLQRSAERFRRLFEQASDAFFVHDFNNGRIVDANESACKHLGYTRHELLELSVSDIEVSHTPEAINEICGRVETDGPVLLEGIHRRKDGSTFPVEVSLGMLQDENPPLLLAIVRDTTERKKAKEALRESENRFRLFMNRFPGVAFINDPGKFMIYVNSVMSNFYGLKPEEIIGLKFEEYITPDFLIKMNEQDRIVISENRFLEIEETVQGVSGPREWWVCKFPIHQQNKPTLVGGLGIEITDRKQAKEALRKSEERFRYVLDNSIMTIYNFNLNTGTYDYLSPAVKGMYGYSAEEFIAGGLRKTMRNFHPDDLTAMNNHLENLLAKKLENFSSTVEYRFKHPKLGYRWISDTRTVIFDDNGNPASLIGNAYDITDRKQAEEELRKSEKKLRIQNQVSNIFLTKNDKDMYGEILTVVLDIMESKFGVFGYIDQQGDLVCQSMTKDIWDQCQMSDKTIVFPRDTWGESIWGNGLRTGKPAYSNNPFKVPEGHIPVERCLTVPLVYERESIGLFTVANKPTDYTESDKQTLQGIAEHVTPVLGGRLERIRSNKALRESEERFQQSQKMESIGDLAGGIAHDFNNILFPIVGMAELLLEDLSPDSLEYQNAKQILNAGKRGSELVRQILAFSRRTDHKMAPVRIQGIIEEVLKLSRSTIPSNIEITQNLQGDRGFVMADINQLHQVAMNLITNAYHAVEQAGGSISVQLKERALGTGDLPDTLLKPGTYVMLSVSDTGCGIDPAVMEKIFEPYFTTKEQGKGTGLGLAVVYGIIKEHGGDVKVQSDLGIGTSVDVYLPLLEESSQSESAAHVEIHPTGSERILLVDDEESIANLEKQIIERLGYQVTLFTNSLDALSAFRRNPDAFDLVITDMTMPRMTGDQFAKAMISIRQDIAIIICTGFSEKLDREKAKRIGIKGFLKKPVSKSDFARFLRKVLDEAKCNA